MNIHLIYNEKQNQIIGIFIVDDNIYSRSSKLLFNIFIMQILI